MNYSNTSSDKIEQIAEEFPSRLLVMLYDDMLDNLDVIEGAIEADDIEMRYSALDLRNGGTIAANLASLYKHGIQQMTDINFSNDPAIAAALRNVLGPLRDSWADLDERIQADVNEAESMILDPAFANALAQHQAQSLAPVAG